MSRARDVVGVFCRINRHLDCARAIMRRNAGCDAVFGLNRVGEGGVRHTLIMRRHET